MTWYTLTDKHMPPIDEDVLLWRAVNESDGGLVTIGKRVRFGEDTAIRYLCGSAEGWRFLDRDDYRTTRWALISPPYCVIKKIEKRRKFLNENGYHRREDRGI